MQFDYFYGSQAEQFSFYRIPKVLFTDPQFKPLSTDAKVLYGILLDRMSLSVKNHWLDEQSRVYIIFTTEEIMEALSCANQKACRLMLELEKDAGLIERKRQGLGKPSLIYVKKFAVEELGVDSLMVDEAHYFKNAMVTTKMTRVAGISQTESQKASDMYMKCMYMDELTGGHGIVFATGTPISNSMTEMYIMMRYLQYGLLEQEGLLNFDAWASTFGESVTAIELAPEGYTLIGR